MAERQQQPGGGGEGMHRRTDSWQEFLSRDLVGQLWPPPANTSELTPEQAQQARLSRLLLLLGSFVILCLLLF